MRYIISVRKVPLNRGGYDRNGRYWGIGPSLYEGQVYREMEKGQDQYYETTIHVRATSNKEAKVKIRSEMKRKGY